MKNHLLAACLAVLCCAALTGCAKSAESSVTGAVVTMPTESSSAVIAESSASAEENTQPAESSADAAENSQQPADSTSAEAPGEQTDTTASLPDKSLYQLHLSAPDAVPQDGELPITVSIEENPGFNFIGIRLFYEEKLDAVGEDVTADYLDGEVTDGMLSSCALNRDKRLVGYVATGLKNTEVSGEIFTCRFQLPTSFQPGDSYSFRMELVKIVTEAGEVDVEGTEFTETVTVG